MSSNDSIPDLTPQDLSNMWVRDGITESHADNGLDIYEADLGFNRTDLEGKSVLEVGIGHTARLQRDIKAAGINATVIGISPDLIQSWHRNPIKQKASDVYDKNIAAIAEVLPFANESFDEIFALYSLTYYTYEPEQTRAWTEEFARVLKPGGNVRLGPDYREDNLTFGENNEVLRQYAEASGLILREEKGTGPGGEYLLLHKPVKE